MATPVFDQVTVDFLLQGSTRVQWQINPHFHELEPWSFQLQIAETDSEAGNWIDVGLPVVDTFFKLDSTQRLFGGKEPNVFYRVVLTTADLQVFTSPAGHILGHLDIRSIRWAHEFVRKETLRLKSLRVGTEGFLLKAKRSGTPCTDCLDPFTGEVTDSNCPSCYGLRWDGGYYDPIPLIFTDATVDQRYLQRDLENGEGMTQPLVTQGFFLAFPWLSTMDIWIAKSTDVRYHVHEVKTRVHIRGVPILSAVGLRAIPFDNIVYSIPLPP